MTFGSNTAKKVCSVLAASALCCVALASCSGAADTDARVDSPNAMLDISNASEGVAATVNGTVIGERAVTAYVAHFRDTQGLSEDVDWAQWMNDGNYTPEKVRSDTIDYYAGQLLLEQAAAERGAVVPEEDIDARLEAARSQFESDEAWTGALESLGATEEQYRREAEIELLQNALEATFVEEATVSDEDVLASVQMYAATYNGAKRSSYILFDPSDAETAREVAEKLRSGQLAFSEAAKEYSIDASTSGSGGDAGWDKMESYDTTYQAALDELGVGEVSGIVTGERGLYIIECTDLLEAPDQIESLSQVSRGFTDYVRSLLKESAAKQDFSDWMREYKEKSDIQVNDMPEGLPYDISISETLEAEGEDDSVEASDSADSSQGDE